MTVHLARLFGGMEDLFAGAHRAGVTGATGFEDRHDPLADGSFAMSEVSLARLGGPQHLVLSRLTSPWIGLPLIPVWQSDASATMRKVEKWVTTAALAAIIEALLFTPQLRGVN
jgi:hypothetical protein